MYLMSTICRYTHISKWCVHWVLCAHTYIYVKYILSTMCTYTYIYVVCMLWPLCTYTYVYMMYTISTMCTYTYMHSYSYIFHSTIHYNFELLFLVPNPLGWGYCSSPPPLSFQEKGFWIHCLRAGPFIWTYCNNCSSGGQAIFTSMWCVYWVLCAHIHISMLCIYWVFWACIHISMWCVYWVLCAHIHIYLCHVYIEYYVHIYIYLCGVHIEFYVHRYMYMYALIFTYTFYYPLQFWVIVPCAKSFRVGLLQPTTTTQLLGERLLNPLPQGRSLHMDLLQQLLLR